MDLMARESDDAVSIDFNALSSTIDIKSTHNTYGQKSYLTTSDLIPFQSSNPTFDLPETSDYKKYQTQISAVLTTALEQNTQITAETFSTIPAADRAGVLTALVDAGILNYYPARSHYGIRYDYIKNHKNTLTTTDLKQMLEPKSDDNPNGLGYIDNNSEIQSHAIDLTEAVPASVKGKLTDEQFRQLQRMMVNKQSGKTLHLSQAAAAIDEAGAGFQIANVDLINVARKNFMLMTMSRRVFMTLTSAYSKLFESLSKKLDGNATSSSHYGDWQSNLMESHIGIAERQLSSVHSSTVQMTERINEMHKLRLNLVKLADPYLRGLDITSTWTSIVGALLMLTPTPLTHVVGIFFDHGIVHFKFGRIVAWVSS